MFSIKKCVITDTTTYSLVKVTYAGDLSTVALFAEKHQNVHYDDFGGTGWYNVVSKPVYDVLTHTTSALLLVDVYHSETTLELDTPDFNCFSNVVEALFDRPVSRNTKVAAYELSTCELEYACTIENSTMVAAEQLPLTVELIDTLWKLNSIEKPPVIPVEY